MYAGTRQDFGHGLNSNMGPRAAVFSPAAAMSLIEIHSEKRRASSVAEGRGIVAHCYVYAYDRTSKPRASQMGF